jgi:CHAT domain-containing protein/TPR repeat protein
LVDFDRSYDVKPCEIAARLSPKNARVKGLLAFLRLKYVADRRLKKTATADLANAAKAGDPFALYVYGRSLIKPDFLDLDIKRNIPEGRAALQDAARRGYADAAFFLSLSTWDSRYAFSAEEPRTSIPDWRSDSAPASAVEDARRWLELSASGGHYEAKAALAQMLATKDFPVAGPEVRKALTDRIVTLVEASLANNALSANDAVDLLIKDPIKQAAGPDSARQRLVLEIGARARAGIATGTTNDRFEAAKLLAEKIVPEVGVADQMEIANQLLVLVSESLEANAFRSSSDDDYSKASEYDLTTVTRALNGILKTLSSQNRSVLIDKLIQVLELAAKKNTLPLGELVFEYDLQLWPYADPETQRRVMSRTVEILETLIADTSTTANSRAKALRHLGRLLIDGERAPPNIDRGVSLMLEADRTGGVDIVDMNSAYFAFQQMGLCSPSRKILAKTNLQEIKAKTDSIMFGVGLFSVNILSHIGGCTATNETDINLLKDLSRGGFSFADADLVRAFTNGEVVAPDYRQALRYATEFRKKTSAVSTLNLLLQNPALAGHSADWIALLRDTASTSARDLKELPGDRNAWQFETIGQAKLYGLGTERDIPAGIELIKKAAAQDDEDAKAFLVLRDLREAPARQDWDSAVKAALAFDVKYFDESALPKLVSRALARSVGLHDIDIERRERVLRDLAWAEQADRGSSRVKLGQFVLEGIGVPADPQFAAAWFAERAAAGDASAAGSLALLRIRGAGVARDFDEARRLIESHAVSAAPEIAYARALLREKMDAASSSVIESDLSSADTRGFLPARRALAFRLIRDESRKDRGWVMLEKLAKDGDPAAAFAIGERYYKGLGVPKSLAVARAFYDRADAQQLLEAGLAMLVLAADEGAPALIDRVGQFLSRYNPYVREHGLALDGVMAPDIIARLAGAHATGDFAKISGTLHDIRRAFDAVPTVVDRFAIWSSNLDQQLDIASLVAPLSRMVEENRDRARRTIVDADDGADTAGYFDVAARAASILDHGDDALALRVSASEARRIRIRGQGQQGSYFGDLREAEVWNKLSRECNDVNRPDAAVFFAKRSINLLQSSRLRLSRLDADLQKAFTETHQDSYRWLASLFIQMGRLGEAEFVLQLLKDFELREYVRRDGVGRDGKNERFSYSESESRVEETISTPQWSIVAIAKKRQDLIEIRKTAGLLSPEQKSDFDALTTQLEQANAQFDDYIADLTRAVRALDRITERDFAQRNMNFDRFGSIQSALKNDFGEKAVSLHYVVLPDSINIIFTSASVQRAWLVSSSLYDLTERIRAFRELLKNPSSDPVPQARELYDLLLRPAEAEIAASGADTLLVSLDRILRYLPFGTLHDGNGYLVERMAVVGLVEAGREGLSARMTGPLHVSAFAASRGGFGLDPLPFARVEVETIVRNSAGVGVANGEIYLDDNFTRPRFQQVLDLGAASVVHIATHFVLQPGSENDSYLLLGDGNRMTAADLKRLPSGFAGVDLLALSACQTALPTGTADGSELESFGALAMNKGARSVIATLWSVADPSTASFMQYFYELRQSGRSKGEALARTQRAFIKGEVAPKPVALANVSNQQVGLETFTRGGSRIAPGNTWKHPYYWAPFLLMGNFL